MRKALVAKLKGEVSVGSLLSLLGLIFFIVLLRRNSLTAPFERDEGEYAYSAWLLRRGLLPYEQAFLQKPPLIIYTYYLGQRLAPEALWPPRVLALVFVALIIVLTGVIARKEVGRGFGLITMWLTAAFLHAPFLTPFAANTELFLTLPLLGAVSAYLWGRGRESSWPWVGFGVCAALALLYKPIPLLALIFVFFVWLREVWVKHKNLPGLLKAILLAVTGGLVTVSLVFGPFLVRGGAKDLWECVVLFNFSYLGVQASGLKAFLNYLKAYVTFLPVFSLLLIWFLISRPRRFGFYFGVTFFSLLAVYRSYLGHYYLFLMPFLAIACSFALKDLTARLSPHLRPSESSFLLTALIFVSIFFSYWPIYHAFFLTPRDFVTWTYGTGDPFLEAEEVAKYLAKRTGAEDRVFVAGSEPQILYHAQRFSPTRFVITYPLSLPTAYSQAYQEEVIASLQKSPPKIIVLSRYKNSGLHYEGSPTSLVDYLNDLLHRDYRLVAGYWWRGDEGFLLEGLTSKQAAQSSLLLFEKADSGEESSPKISPVTGEDWIDGSFFRRVSSRT